LRGEDGPGTQKPSEGSQANKSEGGLHKSVILQKKGSAVACLIFFTLELQKGSRFTRLWAHMLLELEE
jgi:hypothetical protein